MRHMFIVHNHQVVQDVLGEVTVQFASTEDDLTSMKVMIDCALARDAFGNDLPTATIVEHFVQETRNTDFKFVEVMTAPRSREQAFTDKYGLYEGQHQ